MDTVTVSRPGEYFTSSSYFVFTCSKNGQKHTRPRLRGVKQHVLETVKLKRAPSPRHISVTAGNQWLKEKDGGPMRVFSHRPRFFIAFLSFLFNFHVAENRRSEQERKNRLTEPSMAEQISRRHGDNRGVTWNSAASICCSPQWVHRIRLCFLMSKASR